MQAEVNIGTLGHVDHGKTTLIKAISGEWVDRHSEELKRGISIRIGYVDVNIYKCGSEYKTKKESGCEFVRRVSFVDAPGHESLMASAISASSIMDGVLFIIAANEKCPQPQTLEHLMILEAMGIKNAIIVQTKIDLVSKERAKEHMKEIKEFVNGTILENAPIIPVVATTGVNVNYLLEAIEKYIPTPKRDPSKDPRFYVSRSFDVNKPGTSIDKLVGGVLGGSLAQGEIKVGDELELKPGINGKPLKIKVVSLMAGKDRVEKARPGGLLAIGTELDPSLTKGDALMGNLVGKNLPDVIDTINVEYHLLERAKEEKIRQGEPLILGIQTSPNVGVVLKIKDNKLTIKLKRPVCVDKGTKIAINKRVGQRWKLIAWGLIG